MRFLVFGALVVLSLEIVTHVDGLKANDTGVCVVSRSVKKTQRRVFIVKYKCGRKICTARRNKIKDNIVTQNDTVCCKGWTYSSDIDACTPSCSRGCVGGRCTAPDICQCDPPSILDQENKNVCYLPKCKPPCISGICIANNTCNCLQGYKKVNNTCEPKCEKCQNGRCTSPNNCECFEGFVKHNGTCTRPVCTPSCINGICSENNTCTCLKGYEKVNNTCDPKCETCQNGRCTSPNNCECFQGYVKQNGTCSRPICTPPCIYGVCTVNNTCTCLHGYEKVNNTCEPKCEQCQNGRCLSPNNCKCIEGYGQSDGVCKPLCTNDGNVMSNKCKCVTYENEITSCFKSCDKDCVVCDLRGVCRPNDCGSGKVEVVCCEGYIWDYDKKTKSELCKPICRPSCGKYGECIKYNQCRCKPPYEFRDNTCLLPIKCDTPCQNGKCTGHNTCTCHAGFQTKNASYCEPECKQTCVNSNCTAPDRCECLSGYTRKSQWECAPLCDGCEHGECIGPNICRCNNGYFRQGDKCVPICDGNCPNGQCLKPGECICDPGYTNDQNKLTCRPNCESGCINATCTSPNQCACLPGYTYTNATACKPKCNYCSNGDCVGPNICTCHEGYTMTGKKCTPVCSKTCVNGFCSEPEKCSCLGGYIGDGNDKFLCKPECQNCMNGTCSSPELCSCNEGFELRNGTCNPVCSQSCVNGYCIAPNVCGCVDGHKLTTTPEFSICQANDNETIDCKSCEGNCTDTICSCPDGRACELIVEAPRTGLAGLELTWILGACIGLLLFIFVIAIMGQMWRNRANVKTTYAEGNTNGSVVFTAPGTLTNRTFTDNRADEDLYNSIDRECEEEDEFEIDENRKQTSERLLRGNVMYEDEKL